jgi:hypothetical protein
MMSRVQLEVFHVATATPASDIVVLGKLELEETRLFAFDKGYAAGWDDATTAVTTDRSAAETEVLRNLQALGFTFQEARMHLLRGLRPLLTTMMGRLLPEMGRAVLCDLVLDVLIPQAEATLSRPATVHAHPRTQRYLDGLIARAKGMPLKTVDDPALGEGQVFVRFADGNETLIDIDRAVAQILSVVGSFFEQSEQERQYG